MYKRPIINRPEKPHPLQENWGSLGQIKSDGDPGWIVPHLTELMEDGNFALGRLQSQIETAIKLDMSELKSDVAKAKRTEMILKAKRALMTFLKKPIDKARSDVNAVGNAILRLSEPDKPSDPVKAMIQELRHQEIRALIRETPVKQRKAFVSGNLERIQALVNSPDEILSQNHLLEIRRDYAFAQDATLEAQEKDQILISQAIRRRAAEINGTAVRLFQISKLDDPLPPAEHFDTFPPQGDYETFLAQKKIQEYDKAQDEKAKRKEFDEKNQGINLEAGARAARIERGIQH